MADKLLFYYFGDDEAYYRALQGEFRKHTRLIIDFKRIYDGAESKIQGLLTKVFETKPQCIFIDFSKNTQDYLHLARLLSRTPMEHTFATIGVVDYLSPHEVICESIATGVTLTHIKSAETYDVIFDVVKLIAPSEIGEHGFATAPAKEEWEAGILCKVGHVNPLGMHIETNYDLGKGSIVNISHYWQNKKIVPSKQFFVKDISKENIYYQYNYAVDLEFKFVDEFIAPEGLETEKIQEKQNERNDLVLYHKKQLQKWINDNESRSQEKKAKILVVDRGFHFYLNQPRTDKHPYLVRCIPFFDDLDLQISRLRPQVIAFALEATGKNTIDQLNKLVDLIKQKYKNLDPFLVIFNCSTPSKELQGQLNYQHTMASAGELSVDAIIQMADLIQKRIKPEASQIQKVFLTKTNEAAIAEINIPITITKISETDLTFTTNHILPVGTNLHIQAPVPLFIHVLPSKAQGKVPEYYGLIHCLGEIHKKELRKFINSVFFRDHDAQLQAETEEFKKLNEAKLNEKLEEEKKALEEKAKEEKESSES
ncbi:MAG: hypothetical protein AB7I27_16600 [Bacteriovoracaceae bacterium]